MSKKIPPILAAFGTRVAFLYEKHSKLYIKYGTVSIAEEKVTIVQKLLQCYQLSWSAGRSGA